ncbi:hypothetical protein ACA910_009351 [Epithemia clementina (nom. ined.)]
MMIKRVFKTLFPRFESTEEPSVVDCHTKNNHRHSLDELLLDLDKTAPEVWGTESDSESSPSDGEENNPEESSRTTSNRRRVVGLMGQKRKSKKQCRRRQQQQEQQQMQQKAKTKEDVDVEVFLALTEKMSVSSLLFILQDHARQMHSIQQGQLQMVLSQHCQKKSILSKDCNGKKPLTPAMPLRRDLLTDDSASVCSTATTSANKKVKKFRFAEILGGQQIRVEVHEIPKVTDSQVKAELWWTDDEMRYIRLDALRVVRFYEQHRADYATSITTLAESFKAETNDLLVEHHMKRLSADSMARGLEPHLVQLLAISRVVAVQTVLLEQAQCQEIKAMTAAATAALASPRGSARRKDSRQQQQADVRGGSNISPSHANHCAGGKSGKSSAENNNNAIPSNSLRSTTSISSHSQTKAEMLDDQDAERIRRAYREASQPCRTLALKMAKWDHVEALKASLSSW